MERRRNFGFRFLSDDASGVALLELTLVTPLLLLLFVGTIEFSRLIRTKQAVNSFTRELSKTVARQCRSEIEDYDTEDPAATSALLEACMGQFSGSVSIQLGSETLNIDVIASVYKWKLSDGSAVAAGVSFGPFGCPLALVPGFVIECSGRASRMNSAVVLNRHGAALSSAGDLVFVESYVGLKPLAGNALSVIGLQFPEVYTVGVS